MRILVDIGDPQVRELAALGKSLRQPRAALIRAAVDEYLGAHRRSRIEEAYGLWGSATADGLSYQEKARAEW